jgi:hypothetical protein
MRSADIEQADRRRLAGSTTATTNYRDLAEAGLSLEAQGRHAAKAAVSGSKVVPQYPRMPENNPWHCDIVPPEGPLGYSVQDDVEPVGTPKEVEESLLRLAASSACLRRTRRMRRLRKAIPPRGAPQTALLPLGCSLGPHPQTSPLVMAARPHSRRSKVTLTTRVRPPYFVAGNFKEMRNVF